MTARRDARDRPDRPRGAIFAALAAILAIGAGCDDTATVPIKPISAVPSYTLEELRAAPEDLKLGGIVFTVHAELWRDFMPVGPPDGSPLAAFVEVTAVGESVFPGDVTAVYLWVLKDAEVWGVKTEFDATIPRPPGVRVYVAGGGPKWGPEIDVEVVVGFRVAGGAVHLIRIPSVPIQRSS